ncbi:MAG: peptidase M23 [Chitinophagales bacterium]|nr:MAG: peptidase M23 [Chitinophagales bacterium]
MSCPDKKNSRIAFSVAVIAVLGFAMAQTETFRLPLEIQVGLAGTFGEIRGSHFHSGIDIRTQGNEGLPVYAANRGYVSRIKISRSGYGKALYITHPDGYTTVYAHLQKFNDQIEKQIKAIQYARETFEIDEYFTEKQMPVERGELIAFSGNSGRSTAPHLHFEIRDSRTEHPLNPLAFLQTENDKQPPVMQTLFIYDMTESKGRFFPIRQKIIKHADGKYALAQDTLKVAFQKAALGLYAFDGNGTARNGVYTLTASTNRQVFYRLAMDRLSFSENRYALAHSDYALAQKENITVHRLHRLPGDYFSFYDRILQNGILTLTAEPTLVTIAVSDFTGNESRLSFFLQLDINGLSADFSALEYDTIFDFRRDNIFQNDEVRVELPKNTCYDWIYFNYAKAEPASGHNIYSSVHRIHTELEPAHQYFTLYIKPLGIPDRLREKALIVRETKDSLPEPLETTWDGSFLKARTRDFGKYYVIADTIPPLIQLIRVMQDSPAAPGFVQIRIKDEHSGIKSYHPVADGKWILMEYDEKNDMLTYFYDERISPGPHQLFLKVTDRVGNTATFQTSFIR